MIRIKASCTRCSCGRARFPDAAVLPGERLFHRDALAKRGLAALLKQRAVRIVIPCFVSLVTIIPLLNWVSAWAIENAVPAVAPDDGRSPRLSDREIRPWLATACATDWTSIRSDSSFGATPLAWAAMLGDADSAKLLLDGGAEPEGNEPRRLRAVALRGVPWPGQGRRGASRARRPRQRRSLAGQTPLETTTVDWDTTQFIAKILQIPVGTETTWTRARQGPAMLEPITQTKGDATQEGASAAGSGGGLIKAYRRFLDSDRWTVHAAGASFDLIRAGIPSPLVSLVPLLARVGLRGDCVVRRTASASPSTARAVHTRSATCGSCRSCSFHSGSWASTCQFGPDTSTGIVPMPHLLLYYGIFFGFGARYYDANDDEGRLARRWWFLLPFALVIALPVGLATLPVRGVTAVAQAVYAWFMSFGTMGLFRRVLRESAGRSVHLRLVVLALPDPVPLVIAAEAIVDLAAAFARQVRAAPGRGDGNPPAVVSAFRSVHVDRSGPERPADASS